MNRSIHLLAIVAGVCALAACDEPKPAPAPSTTTAPAAAATIVDEDLAVPADFEEEATKAITVANYKVELDTLESEIQ